MFLKVFHFPNDNRAYYTRNTKQTTPTHHAMDTSTLVLPIWIGQQGPIMPLGMVDEYPVVILSPMATQAEIDAAVEGLRAVKKA
jgi:hypothetical protein